MGAYRYCECDQNDPVPMSTPTLVEALTCEYRCPSCGVNHWREDDRAFAVEGLVERLEALEAKTASPAFVGVDLASGPDMAADAIIDMDEVIHVAGHPDDWRPISSAPRTGRQIELGGPSGYMAPNDWHAETGRWRKGSARGWWVNDAGDAYTECWPEPTHWRPCRHLPRSA